jgi:hypothetical protein
MNPLSSLTQYVASLWPSTARAAPLPLPLPPAPAPAPAHAPARGPMPAPLIPPAVVPVALDRYPMAINCFAQYVQPDGASRIANETLRVRECPSNETVGAVCASMLAPQQPPAAQQQAFSYVCKRA